MRFMKSWLLPMLALPLLAAAPRPSLAPSEIVAAAPMQDWIDIPPEDLLIMDLATDAAGRGRRIVLQVMPAPFSQGWVENIRSLARAHWWDGLAIVRVQDNYVAQWGDLAAEDKASAKPLPSRLRQMTEADYLASGALPLPKGLGPMFVPKNTAQRWSSFFKGWPIAGERTAEGIRNWPVHCYGMMGVGRNLAPDTGTGAELYVVIGHAPRHLDRNIALAGRVVAGIEHLSSLSRGTGPLGFYEKAEERVTIQSLRIAADMDEGARPRFQYLSTESASFRRYAEARANRRDAFFNVPAGGADICNIPVPVRKVGR
ncbi:MAG: peptidylprolyl isomerase [Sphingomonadaceae bacterium]|nr:peptidylprolyl isomerase [Sphingomonadaceae bacterium]